MQDTLSCSLAHALLYDADVAKAGEGRHARMADANFFHFRLEYSRKQGASISLLRTCSYVLHAIVRPRCCRTQRVYLHVSHVSYGEKKYLS